MNSQCKVGVAYAGVECSERAASRRSAQAPPLYAILAAPHHRLSLIWIPKVTYDLIYHPGKHPVFSTRVRPQQTGLLVYETKPAATVLSGCQPEGSQPEGGAQGAACSGVRRACAIDILAALALLVQSDSDTQENSLRLSWAAPSGSPTAVHPVTSSAPRVRD